MKTVIQSLVIVAAIFVASCSCHSGSSASEPSSYVAPSAPSAPAFVMPTK